MSLLEPVFYSRSFTAQAQPWHKFKVLSCAWSAMGGPKTATLRAQQPNPLDINELAALLRCPVELWDSGGRRAWWGLVNSVRVKQGAAGLSFSLDDLANKVRVCYSQPDPARFTGSVQLWTAWAENALSQSVYGIKEKQLIATHTDAAQAARLRDSTLPAIHGPIGQPFWLSQPGELIIELECRGWFDTLDWRYYDQAAGDVSNVPNVPGATQAIGSTTEPYVAQSFTTPVGGWRLDGLWVSLKQVGALADNLTVVLCADSAGSPNGAVVHSYGSNINGAGLPFNFAWRYFSFPSPYTLAANTPYWLFFMRTGALDNASYYRLQMDESLAYPNGSFKIHNGAAWAARNPETDLMFYCVGSMANSAQISLVAANPGGGQFLTGLRLDSAPTIFTNPHREGLSTCKAELLQLLSAGNASGPLLAEVSAERVLIIKQRPGSASPMYTLASDGLLRLRGNAKAPPGPGIAGEWAALDTLWSNTANGSDLVPGRVFLSEVQWTPTGVTPLNAR